MELLHHYITHTSLYPLVTHVFMKDIVMSIGLREPYVMHALLALSAHHLSVTRPDRHDFYHNLAIQLQTRALSLFNSIDVASLGDSVQGRVPMFIFSCVLGFHALCDALAHRDPDFGSAIARFLAYVRLHRGIHTVMDGYWDDLRNTELRVIFDEMVPSLFHLDAEGRECDDIRDRIKSSSLTDEEIEAAQKAIDLAQWVFDAKPNPESRAYVLCSWVAMLPRPFVRILVEGRPEALAVLAYYFLAMHYCRDVWMIRGAGQHLLALLVDHFRGGEWYAWVEIPYRMLQESLAVTVASSDQPVTDFDSLSSHPRPANHSEQTC
ncbi:6d79b124-7117-4c3e-8624-883a8adc57ac [Thermothielavioides terrestris]|uniref:6d79b124-7117-4c3e-8624-883a8adc57ac n=1 Tax=Thermothielavioides terrestris TaxID=2587410 RepID=A0A446BX00_9PEZI|nr:6d79b124-7117-4c3e-8624-883a8adc57ac [Thermothielavioides terrestris]